MIIIGKRKINFSDFCNEPLSKWFTKKLKEKMYFLSFEVIDAGIAHRWNWWSRSVHFDVLFLFQTSNDKKFFANEYIEELTRRINGILISGNALKRINNILNKIDIIEKVDCFGKTFLSLYN